jgi:hypothetical protein
MNVRPVPEHALRDPDAVEMARVWIAERGLHRSLKIGMYQESYDVPEQRAWGTILADMTRHIANALREKYGLDAEKSIDLIRDAYIGELASPTSDAKGGFVPARTEGALHSHVIPALSRDPSFHRTCSCEMDPGSRPG